MANGQLFNLFEPDTAQTLGRLGASLQGTLGQFEQGQAIKADQEQRKQQQSKQLSQERQKAMLTDNRVLLDHLKNGRTGKAQEFLMNRIGSIGALGGDPTDTANLLALLNTGQVKLATDESQLLDDEAVIRGQLEPIAGSKGIKASDVTKQGQTFSRDPITGQVTAQDVAGFRGEPTKAELKNLQPQINTLRKDITNAGKDFNKVEAARNRILNSGTRATAASDISLIFNFMKMNDPGSTVREGEFATAQNAAGVPDRVLNLYNKLREGTRLSPKQRDDFIAQSELLFDAQREAFDTNISNTLQQADQDNIPRVRILGKKRLAAFDERTRTRQPIAPTAPEAPAAPQDLSQLSLEQLQQMLQQAQ